MRRQTGQEPAPWLAVTQINSTEFRTYGLIFVSGRSKPASTGRMKTSHFEGRIALGAAVAALGRDESTQREPATFDFDFGGTWLVAPADCAGTGHQPGDGRQVSAAGLFKTGHFDPRLGG